MSKQKIPQSLQDIVDARRKNLAPKGMTFDSLQCGKCDRWFNNQRPINEPAPTIGPCCIPSKKGRKKKQPVPEAATPAPSRRQPVGHVS